MALVPRSNSPQHNESGSRPQGLGPDLGDMFVFHASGFRIVRTFCIGCRRVTSQYIESVGPHIWAHCFECEAVTPSPWE